MRPCRDIFTRTVHGIRLKYAAVSVVFLALLVVLFHLGGPRAFGWYDFFVVFVLGLMVLVLFIMHCHYVLGPMERLTGMLNELLGRTLDGTDPLRVQWNGKDEVSCLVASLNGVLEAVQSRSVGTLEENRRLRDVIASADVVLVAMNRSGSVLNVIHSPPQMEPVPGLSRGFEPDAAVWGEANRKTFKDALAAVFRADGGAQSVALTFNRGEGHRPRRMRVTIRRPANDPFPLVIFRDEACPVLPPAPSDRGLPLARVAIGVANDLRNVFSVIRTSATRYADTDKPEVRETVATICRAIDSGSAMMDDLLLLGGELQMRMRRLGVTALVDAARPVIDATVAGSGASVVYDLGEGLPVVVADQGQFNCVLANVVRNSVEAFGAIPGKVSVSARAHVLTDEEGQLFTPPLTAGDGVLIGLSDDGPGISEPVRRHIFEPYVTTKPNRKGLGLATSNAIVAAHGGGMRILSTRDPGTTVEIFLRASARPDDEAAMIRKEFPGGEVLVVDDSRSILRITAALLRTQKIAAHVADCRADALRKFGELAGRLRAVFLDAQLGESKTVCLLSNMRSIDPTVPIVVVSGYTREQIEEIFASCPADAFLMKPYTIDELKQVLDRLQIHPAEGKEYWL